jgi:predicted enzyme related to lactoylglutathione lyase
MAKIRQYKHGEFCWHDLETARPAEAKKFYLDLFHWNTKDVPMGDGGQSYTVLTKKNENVAGLFPMPKESQSKGMNTHWNTYIAVDNIQESTKKAKSLGATLLAEPFKMGDQGYMAVIKDPTGATVNLWKSTNSEDSALVNEEGAPCWNELITQNLNQARDFYSKLFGWKIEAQKGSKVPYYVAKLGSERIGGMIETTPTLRNALPGPSTWITFFQVDACNRTAESAKKQGGTIVVEPTTAPHFGTFSLIKDPQGSVFSVMDFRKAS